MVAGPREQATDGEEEEQVVVKDEVIEEEAQEFENLSAGPGVPMVKIEMDLLEDMEVKTEAQDEGEVSQVEGGEQGCRICVSMSALLTGTFFILPGTFHA